MFRLLNVLAGNFVVMLRCDWEKQSQEEEDSQRLGVLHFPVLKSLQNRLFSALTIFRLLYKEARQFNAFSFPFTLTTEKMKTFKRS